VIARALSIPQEEQEEILKTGQSRFGNQVDWARFYLAKAEYLDSSRRGVWTLTAQGATVNLSPEESLALFKKVHGAFTADNARSGEIAGVEDKRNDLEEAEAAPIELQHRTHLLEVLTKSLSPGGFERLCQRFAAGRRF